MASIRKIELDALREALAKLDGMIAAAEGKESSCVAFRDEPGRDMHWTEDQKRSVRLYLETWVRSPLVAAIVAIEGERGWQNESSLRSITGRGWW